MKRREILLLCAWPVAAALAQPDVSELLEQKTLAKIRALDDALDGTLGLAAIDLTTGRTLAYRAETVFPSASTIKIPVMIELYRQARAGALRLDHPVTVDPKELAGSSPRLELPLRRGPAAFTVRELIGAMIEVSDNTAANKLIDLAGMDRVNRLLDELGCPKTRLRRKMMDWAAAARNDENVSTPLELARLVELIYRGKAADEASCAEMLSTMKRVEADMRRAIPARIEVASKPGELPAARCETGIVFLPKRPFALAVMSAFLRDDRNPVPEATSVVYRYFEQLAQSNRYGRRLE